MNQRGRRDLYNVMMRRLAGCALLCAAGGGVAAAQGSGGAKTTAVAPKADTGKAEDAYLAGARLLDERRLAEAQEAFARAVALAPGRQDYALALALTREHRVSDLIQRAAQARLNNRASEADSLLAEAAKIDPTNELVLQHGGAGVSQPLVEVATQAKAQFKPSEEASFAPPIALAPNPISIDLHLRGETKQVVAQVATAYGIKTVFDTSVKDVAMRFDLDQSPYGVAMPILLKMTHLIAVPVDAKTVLVAQDTQENRAKFERQVEETIYIPGSTSEQLQELTNIVKNVFDVRQVVIGKENGTLMLRAPEATVKAVNYTLADMIDGGAEVQLDVKLVTIDKSTTHNTGANPPTSFTAFSAAGELQSFVTANQSTISTAVSSGALVLSGTAANQLIQEAIFLVLSGLATDAKLTNVLRFFGNGLTLFAISAGSGGSINLALNSSDTRALDDLSVRVGDHQTTTLRVGERYPVTVSTYSSGVSSATSSALAGVSVNGVSASSLLSQYLGTNSVATVPIIQYEDLGITLKTTPTVLRSGLVSLHVDLKIEALTGASNNNIPILTSSNFVSDITIQDGMTAVMMSELTKSENASISGIPGLGELPGFQEAVADTNKTVDQSELVLMITPHLVRRRNANMASRRILFSSSVPGEN